MQTRAFVPTSLAHSPLWTVMAGLLCTGCPPAEPCPTAGDYSPQTWTIAEVGTITEIGSPEGFYNPCLAKIDDSGRVAFDATSLQFTYFVPPCSQALLLDGSEISRLSGRPGWSTLLAGMNNNGVIVGEWRAPVSQSDVLMSALFRTPGPPGAFAAVVWVDGVPTELPGLPGGTSQPRAVNDLNQIVGIVWSGIGQRAVFWEDDGAGWKIHELGNSVNAPEAQFVDVTDVNTRGQIVINIFGESESDITLVVWEDGVLTELALLSETDTTAYAQAINAAGHVVGRLGTGRTDPDAFGGEIHRAALWQDGTFEFLGSLGGNRSDAKDINDRGQIVGWSEFAPHDFRQHAFVWRNGVMTDLNDFLPAELGIELTEAHSINAQGQIVACGVRENAPAEYLLVVDQLAED